MPSTVSPASLRIGSQAPRWLHRPLEAGDDLARGDAAVELAALVGLMLDEWEALVLREACRRRFDGRWSARTVDLLVGRQNGKGSVLEARQLAGLVLFGERTAVHTAHEGKTCDEHFLRMQELLAHELVAPRVKTIRTANGQQQIVMRTGERLKFVARTDASGRGFTGDVIYLDEAYALTDAIMRALFSTMAARSKKGDPQMWLTSTAPYGDRPQHAWWHSRVSLMRSERRPANGLYIDWGMAPPTNEQIKAAGSVEAAVERLIANRELWWETNPGLGIRISEDFCEDELAILGPWGFAVERCGLVIPKEDAENRSGIDLTEWSKLFADFELPARSVVAVDVDEDGAKGSIAAAAVVNGHLCVELVESGGIGKLVGWLTRNTAAIDRVVYDGTSQAQMVVTLTNAAGLRMDKLTQADVASSEAMLVDAVGEGAVRHRDDPRVRLAILSADRSAAGKRWRWTPRRPLDDVTPIKATALAVAAVRSGAKKPTFAY